MVQGENRGEDPRRVHRRSGRCPARHGREFAGGHCRQAGRDRCRGARCQPAAHCGAGPRRLGAGVRSGVRRVLRPGSRWCRWPRTACD